LLYDKGTTHPTPEQIYTIEDSQSTVLIGHPVFKERLEEITTTFEPELTCLINDDASLIDMTNNNELPILFESDFHAGALIIYTSGTTGKPKGALSTHAIIDAQTSVLVQAWYWSSEDRIHHILPLHHIHGIVNALVCPIYVGATVEMHQKFDTVQVWQRWANTELSRLTTFMSVPTVYCNVSISIYFFLLFFCY
jgi:malonyl-CoA/methylmalonyl-CoA synthetase